MPYERRSHSQTHQRDNHACQNMSVKKLADELAALMLGGQQCNAQHCRLTKRIGIGPDDTEEPAKQVGLY